MIELRINNRMGSVPQPKIESSNLLLALDNLLDKTKFFGKIELTYESGALKFVKASQSFTPETLAKFLTS